MKNHIRVELPVFRTGIDLRYGKVPNMFGDTSDLQLNGRSKVRETYNPCIWIRHKLDFCTLLHELNHCVYDIFERRGIPHNYDTDEVYAYTLEYFFKEFTNKLLKKNKK